MEVLDAVLTKMVYAVKTDTIAVRPEHTAISTICDVFEVMWVLLNTYSDRFYYCFIVFLKGFGIYSSIPKVLQNDVEEISVVNIIFVCQRYIKGYT